jgi:hypothetical protein
VFPRAVGRGGDCAQRKARHLGWFGCLKNAKSADDILSRRGRFTVVEGTVSSARLAGATFYVNFGRRWTRDFAVTISRRMMASVEATGIDLKSLKDKRVLVRGWIETRGGRDADQGLRSRKPDRSRYWRGRPGKPGSNGNGA